MHRILDVLWRAAVLVALCWIGWELHQIHADMFEPVEEQAAEPTAAAV